MSVRSSRALRTHVVTITVAASAALAIAALLAARHSVAAGWWTLAAFVTALAVAYVVPQLPALSSASPRERFEVTDWGVRRYEHRRQQDAVPWSEVEEVAVITTPHGPTSEDMYLVLRGRGGAGVLLTREAVIQSGAIAALATHLATFDVDRLTLAMEDTGDGLTVIWPAAVTESAQCQSTLPRPHQRGAAA